VGVVTDFGINRKDRQTTDGRAIAYSEREREFTFAKNYCIDSNQILHSYKDHKMRFVGGPDTLYKSKMGDVRHRVKVEKSSHLSRGSSDFNEIGHGEAVRPSWPLKV